MADDLTRRLVSDIPPDPRGRTGRNGRLADVMLLLSVVVSSMLWLVDATSPVRPFVTVLALCVAPGWGLCRATGVRASMLTLVVSVAISVSLVMVTGLLLVTRLSWSWPAGVNVVNVLACIGLTVSIARNGPD